MHYDVVIIGAGPVGIFAAFQAGLLGMKVCVVDALDGIGGQCISLYPEKPIYDIPGHSKITGAQLISELILQASRFSPHYIMGQTVISLEKRQDEIFELKTSKGNGVSCKAVMIASGAGAFGPNRPPLAGIDHYEGSSVFYHVQKRQDFAGKTILIAGGGDSAVDWAIDLSEIANVIVVHRRNKFRAADASVAALMALTETGKVRLVTNYQLHGLIGNEGKLRQVELIDLQGEIITIDADILLPFFGLCQDLGPVANFGLDLSAHGHQIAVSQPYYETNIAGIYAIGDVASYTGKLKLIMTGFAEAASALTHSYARVFDGKALHFEHSTSKIL